MYKVNLILWLFEKWCFTYSSFLGSLSIQASASLNSFVNCQKSSFNQFSMCIFSCSWGWILPNIYPNSVTKKKKSLHLVIWQFFFKFPMTLFFCFEEAQHGRAVRTSVLSEITQSQLCFFPITSWATHHKFLKSTCLFLTVHCRLTVPISTKFDN